MIAIIHTVPAALHTLSVGTPGSVGHRSTRHRHGSRPWGTSAIRRPWRRSA